jgi:predicted ATPase with chaperone activity
VARTIADLSGEKSVSLNHIAEAVQYRLPDFTLNDERRKGPSARG